MEAFLPILHLTVPFSATIIVIVVVVAEQRVFTRESPVIQDGPQSQDRTRPTTVSWAEVISYKDMAPDDSIPTLLSACRLSLSECGSSCALEKTCSSFFYNSITRRCLLYDTVFQTLGRLKRSPNFRYHEAMLSEGCSYVQCFHAQVLDHSDFLCLFLYTGNQTQRDSRKLCQSVGADLPVLDTLVKNQVALSYLRANTDMSGVQDPALPPSVFLGASRNASSEYAFFWSDGRPVPTATAPQEGEWSYWDSGSAAAGRGGAGATVTDDDCLALFKTPEGEGGWRAVSCFSRTRYLLCQKF